MLRFKPYQVSEKVHALLNNEALTFSLFKLNIGFWLILDVQILPTPRVWLRVPLFGELIAGLLQYEVCSNEFNPDVLRFEVLRLNWQEVREATSELWEDLLDPELLTVDGGLYDTTLENLIKWGMDDGLAERLSCEDHSAPFLMIRGVSQGIESRRY